MSQWNPIMAAREPEPGVWHMIDSMNRCYGIIRFVRRGGELGYRADTWADDADGRRLIGYYRTLSGACSAVHQRLLTSATPGMQPVSRE